MEAVLIVVVTKETDLLHICPGPGFEPEHPAFEQDDIQGALHVWPCGGICPVPTTPILRLVVAGHSHLAVLAGT